MAAFARLRCAPVSPVTVGVAVGVLVAILAAVATVLAFVVLVLMDEDGA